MSDGAAGRAVVLQAPEYSAYASQKLARIERLCQIVIGADLKA
jgi:hypothetical protein